MTKNQKIEETLNKFPFVKWDRFVQTSLNKFTVYGWINRVKDNYKDFIILDIETTPRNVFVAATTSSEKHSDEIAKILECDWHIKCQRVEKRFKKVKNVIKL